MSLSLCYNPPRMEHFFLDLFRTNLEAWKHWGYGIVFLVAFVESIPLLGMLIPGQIIIILAGFLVKLKIFSFPMALLVTAVGACLGDIAGFAIGKRYSKALPAWVNAILKKEHLEKTQHLVSTHSIKTIFIGRLHSLTRTLTPFAAGTTDVTFRKFIAVDAFSAIIWAFLSLLIGFVFGKSFELAAAFIGRFILVATIVVIILIVAVKFLREHRHRISWTDFSLYGACAVSLYLFAVTAQDIATGRLFHILDIRTSMITAGLRSPALTSFMRFFTEIGNPIPVIMITLVVVLYFALRKRWRDSVLVGSSMLTGVVLVNLLKATFEKVRPEGGLIKAAGSSFPSGHAMMAIILASVISYTMIRHIKKDSEKNSLYTLLFGTAICIGLSRVYLNVHWASDVLAGFFAGAAWVTLMIAAFRFAEWFIRRKNKA